MRASKYGMVIMNKTLDMKMTERDDPLFTYDPNLDLDLQEVSEEVFDDKVVHDVSFQVAKGRRTAAYLVTPITGHGFPGVLFVHPSPGSRKSFLDEALKLADRKVCSVLLDADWSDSAAWVRKLGSADNDRIVLIEAIKDLRRGLDLLNSQPMVDWRRLGYVGHSLGALCGAVLSGIEQRVRTYVLMSGTVSFADVVEANMPDLTKEEISTYRSTLQDIDPVRFVTKAAPASIMFQLGKKEEYFKHERMQALAHAASEPKIVKWYDAGHLLNEEARQDRDGWLVDELFR
jgi:uncharacterized protein